MSAVKPQYKPADQYRPGDVVITNEQILARIKELAIQIAEKYRGKNLLIVGIMKGAIPTMTALAQALEGAGLTDQEWSTITLSRYKNGTKAEGEPVVLHDMDLSPEGRHVLLVDEVLDGGKSLEVALSLIKPKNPASIETFALIEKDGTNVVGFSADYTAFPKAPNVWMEGFGMDTSQKGRGNRHVVVGKDRSQTS